MKLDANTIIYNAFRATGHTPFPFTYGGEPPRTHLILASAYPYKNTIEGKPPLEAVYSTYSQIMAWMDAGLLPDDGDLLLEIENKLYDYKPGAYPETGLYILHFPSVEWNTEWETQK